MTELNNRYEFVILFDVENGNPNGDPDSGNMPRIDVETSYGIVTDVCLKRKIRNYVQLVKGDVDGYKIFITEGVPLATKQKQAYDSLGLTAGKKADPDARQFMCRNYFDVRTFGAVMTTGKAEDNAKDNLKENKKDKKYYNCGQVRGPVQINFARSIDPIFQSEITITRQAITTEDDAQKKTTEMGRKSIVPYGLYRAEGYISANLARQTEFTEADLALLFEAIENMFEHDHSAARGKMAVRKFIVFKHADVLGNAPAHKLFDLITVARKEDKPARAFTDYAVSIDRAGLPSGVEIIERI